MYPKAKLIAVCAKPSGVELLDDCVMVLRKIHGLVTSGYGDSIYRAD